MIRKNPAINQECNSPRRKNNYAWLNNDYEKLQNCDKTCEYVPNIGKITKNY